jgi:DNA repair protein SbcC/Rad50
LNALENERAEILEKIIGPEMSQELEESIRAGAEAENEKLLQLKETAGSFSLMEKSQLNALRESLEHDEEKLQATDRLIEELQAAEEWCRRVELLESAQRDAVEALAAAETRHARLQSDFLRLEQARVVLPFRADVRNVDDQDAEADRLGELLTHLEADIQFHEDQTRDLEARLQQSRLELERARRQLEDRDNDLHNALLRDREIAEESERFLEVVSRYETLEQLQKEKLQLQAGFESQMVETQSRQRELDHWLVQHSAESRLEEDLPAIDKLLVRLREIHQQRGDYQTRETGALKSERRAAKRLHRAESAVRKVRHQVTKLSARKTEREQRVQGLLGGGALESVAAGYHNEKKRLAACKDVLRIGRKYRELSNGEDIQSSLAQISAEQDQRARSLGREQTRLAELEETVRRHETRKKYAADRSLLKPGMPCPLCGGLDHPFAEQGLPDSVEIDRELHEQRNKVAGMQQQLEALRKEAATLQERARALEAIGAQWAKACVLAGGEWGITNLDLVQQEIRGRKKEIKHFKSRIRSVRWQKWRADWVGRSLRRKSDRLAGKEQGRDSLQANHELQREAVASLKNELQLLRQEEQEASEQLSHRVKEYGEQSPGPGKAPDLLERLTRRWELYRAQSRELQAVIEQARTLEARKQVLPDELRQLQEQAESLAAEVQASQNRLSVLKAERDGLFGGMDPVQERRVLEDEMARNDTEQLSLNQEIASLRQSLSEKRSVLPQVAEDARDAQTAAAEARRELMEQLTAAGFRSIDEVREYLIFLEQQKNFTEEWAVAEQTLAEARSRAEAARRVLDSAGLERILDDPLETVRWKLADAGKRREQLQAEVAAAGQALQRQRELEHEHHEALQAVADQEKVYAQAMAEQTVLQSQDPGEFKRKLQRFMLQRLLDKANQHLEMLSGRYYLRPLADEGLGFQVEDVLQGRACRSAKTLSGGESFLVSLCLALGLSDMASRERQIESLFLDEGFGSLDDETLYRVVAALKGLRANGKMVGVISHVKRLADEIRTQIRVEKQPGGVSLITVVA